MLFVCSFGFPDGGGAASRVRAYTQGLLSAGAEARVLVNMTLAPGDHEDVNRETTGAWRGVPFEHMSGTAGAAPGWLRRRLLEVRGAWRTAAAIRASARENPRTAVFIYATRLRWILPVVLACRSAGVPLVHDRSEFPFAPEGETNALGRLFRRAYCARVFRLFDGVLVITSMLEAYVSERVRPDAWVLRVPILVDVDEYETETTPRPGLVGYLGIFGHPAELDAIVQGAGDLVAAGRDVSVRFMGTGDDEALAAIRDAAEARGITERVEFSGLIRAGGMPDALSACSVLALPRVEGVFSSAGMPTKLGEYLASGRPVVVSATGDIPDYLKDGVSAYLVPPGDLAAFTAALERALFDEDAAAVGRAGREVAREHFDPAVHMARMLAALEASW